jgi:hypothetical protein
LSLQELAPLKLAALQRRALAAGAGAGAVDAALDAEDASAALRELLLRAPDAPGVREHVRIEAPQHAAAQREAEGAARTALRGELQAVRARGRGG